MSLVKKIGTGLQILITKGPRAFIKAARYSLSKLIRGSSSVDESRIAFQVLQGNQNGGLMIDVGAHHGFGLSPFAQAGWQIYAFEPDSVNRAVLKKNFGDLPNVMIDPRALSDQEQEKMTLYRSQESSGMSGLSSFHPSHTPSEEVNVTTLKLFLKELAIPPDDIDFLKIDTEGYDLNVLKGIPWKKSPPLLILCEFEDAKTLPLGYDFHDLAQYLIERGYKLIISEWYPVKKYGGVHTWKRFTVYPCGLGDPKAWGNIIATRNQKLFNKLLKTCQLAS
jgi:FkbM family methyltransferase